MKEFYLLNKKSDEEIMDNTGEIIKSLRQMTKLSQTNFGKLYHIPFSTLQGWERGNHRLSPYLLEFIYSRVMLDFEDANPDRKKNDISSVKEFYLLNKESDEEIRNNTRNIVKEIRNISGLSQRQFCELYHMQHGVIAGWESEIKKPSANLLEFMYSRVMLDFGNND